ncbi:Soyasapogenol B glucuronide galactosyltransferase [Stylosanthes scabra]|uniref:Soyasapogenol B glucuronide galactosyltransferase n=1 Tax=Stylosanthes scabra TaxID=79078 RepID=A0ABU6SBE3_9FABA|nr:Soyasapogenol B glucuronide galactosyltransferase [Stylosanthes scabra]
MVDIARVLAMHGVDVTIIASPVAASLFQTSVDGDSSRGRSIRTHVVKFPAAEVGLPDGVETFNVDTKPDTIFKIAKGLQLLEKEIEKLFEELQADCIVTDMFYPWTADAAARLGIPRLIFLGGSYLAHSAYHSVKTYAPHKEIESEHTEDKFVLPGLPHRLEMTPLQLPDWIREPNGYTYLMEMIRDSERRSYGSLFDSFYELEGEYQDHYKKAIGANSWSLGPVSLWANQDAADKAGRGGQARFEHRGKEEEDGCLKWLNSKPESSVLYVSFGSMSKFPSSQLVEIAQALEDSGHDFMWVVKKKDDDDDGGSFLKEFEKRVKASNKGYLIWGWAPQLLILENPAIGGIVTHCGWNTIMESVNAGLAMVTWPMFAEQFFNEKLLVHVLKIGVAVGVKEWKKWQEFGEEVVKKDQIGKAIDVLMGNEEESVEMRRRARELSDAAKRAIQVGGSSHTNVVQLIQELKSLKLDRTNIN